MVVRIGMAPRAAELTMEACLAHWRSAHADAARQLPGLRAYVQNHAVLRAGAPLLPYTGFDVCAETEFDDLAAMDAAFASAQYREAIVADEGRFIDRAGFTFALCERHGSAGDGPVKLMTFLRGGGDPAGDAEWLLVSEAAHAGRAAAPFDAVEVRRFGSPGDAEAFAAGAAAPAGFAVAQRLIALPRRIV